MVTKQGCRATSQSSVNQEESSMQGQQARTEGAAGGEQGRLQDPRSVVC